MKATTKWISVFLILCLFITGCGKEQDGAKKFDDDGFGKFDGIEWYFHADTGLLEVNGTGAIEDEFNNYQWDDFKLGVTECVIGEGITSIGQNAFYKMTYCTKLTLPNTLTDMLYGCFCGCGIESVTVPASVTNMEYGVFSSCDNLTSVTFLGKEIGSHMFADSGRLREFNYTDQLEVIGSGAFFRSRIRNFEIPSSVKRLESEAFFASNLGSVVIPSTVEYVGDNAFYGCDALTTAEIHYDTISNAFEAEGLICVRLGDEVRTICYGSFGMCKKLESIYIPATVTEIEDCVFNDQIEVTIYTTKGSAAWEYCGRNSNVKFCDIEEPGNMEKFEKNWQKAQEKVR